MTACDSSETAVLLFTAHFLQGILRSKIRDSTSAWALRSVLPVTAVNSNLPGAKYVSGHVNPHQFGSKQIIIGINFIYNRFIR